QKCCHRRTPFRPHLRVEFIVTAMFVAPAPRLAAFQWRDQGMARRIVMLERVPMLRILAAPDMPAGEANAQLIPAGAEQLALFATARARRYRMQVGVMFTMLGHIRN